MRDCCKKIQSKLDKSDNQALLVGEKIIQYGMIDGARHKQWLLDQTLRILLGDGYQEIIDEMNSNEEFEPWDEGIAP